MVENVEELRSELQLQLFHQLDVLEDGKVHVFQSRTVETVAPCRSHEVLTEGHSRWGCERGVPKTDGWYGRWSRRRRNVGRAVCSRERGGRIRQRETTGVEIIDSAVNRVAAWDKHGKVLGKIAIESGSQRVVAAANGHGKRSATGRRNDRPQFPSTQQVGRHTRLRPGDIPNERADCRVSQIEV